MEDSSKLNIRPVDLETLRQPASEVVVDGLRPIGPSRLGARREEFQKPIVFNGLLTNKILTALPGPDFAHLLSYLEPVSLYSGQEIYIFGEIIDFIYFPETAVMFPPLLPRGWQHNWSCYCRQRRRGWTLSSFGFTAGIVLDPGNRWRHGGKSAAKCDPGRVCPRWCDATSSFGLHKSAPCPALTKSSL